MKTKQLACFKILQIISYPHITDEKARSDIFNSIKNQLPKSDPEEVKSADDQYEALKRKMKMTSKFG
jgi:hypothetical protein